MISALRGEITVCVLGVAMLFIGALAPGEWGRAFTGGGLVFTVAGSALIIVSLLRRRLRG
jgi:hypothetical protein